MSVASISYSSIRHSANEAKATSKKLSDYADSLNKNVYKKLNNYDGEWSSNVSTASTKVKQKIDNLRTEAKNYSDYESSLTNLKKECEKTDKAVRTNVSSLTAEFKDRHGIRNSKILNHINYLRTKGKNATSIGRWLNNRQSDFEAEKRYHKQAIKDWYNFGGGKQLIKGGLVAILGIAIAVVGILTAGTILAMITAVITGVIAIVGGLVNMYYEIDAYAYTRAGDPATGRRKSDINSVQDMMRSSDEKKYHKAAGILDAINIACGVANLLSSIGSLMKKGFKWATGNTDMLDNIKWKDIFSKNTFVSFKTKIVDTFKSMDFKDFAKLKKFALDFGSDFMNNLKLEYIDKGLKSFKSTLGLTKDIIEKGISVEVILKNIIMPGLPLGQTTTIDVPKDTGQVSFKFESITGKEFYGIYSGIEKIVTNDLFQGNNTLNISIPDIKVPEININTDFQFDFQMA